MLGSVVVEGQTGVRDSCCLPKVQLAAQRVIVRRRIVNSLSHDGNFASKTVKIVLQLT